MRLNCRRWLLILVFLLPAPLHSGEPLPGTAPLSLPGDDASVARRHIKQATDYFRRKLAASAVLRDESWKPDFSAPRAYATWLAPRRAACRKMLGLGSAKTAAGEARSTILAETGGCRVERFTIPVSNRPESAGLLARGLLFSPITKGPHPLLVVCGDATQWPEQMSGLLKGAKPAPWLVKLLGRGAMVYLPQSVERLKDHPYCKTTNHKDRRQILYRLGYVVGRTMTGLDVEDTLAAIEYFAHRADVDAGRIGLVGMGQGGMTALYTAALDRRVQATAVADYFQTHAQLCDEPVDRRLPGQFLEFGDAEVAALVAPRLLFVVHSNESSEHDGPVAIESRRAARFYKGLGASGRFVVVSSVGGEKMLKKSVELVSEGMGLPKAVEKVTLPGKPISKSDAKAQRDRHFAQKLRYLRFLIEASEEKRQRRWNLAACPVSEFDKVKAAMLADYRKLVGKVDTEGRPLRPRTDLVLTTDTYKAYRVVIDVAEGVEAYGHLLVPRGAKGPMAAVIAQHGLSGTPQMITGVGMKKDTCYHEFGRHLAEHGYIVFAPLLAHYHPHKLTNDQARLADATGMMRVAMPVAKTRRIVEFLETLPFVDPRRIGYYGLSYGGYSALWIGPLVDRLAAVIPSGHFNDWRSKITADYTPTSYLRHPCEDFYNWDILHRFTHPELIAMMAPRPVCIEFGQRDGITTPAWTAYAWKQVSAMRDHLGLADRIELAHYDGVHEIHGIETFDFLDRFLRPERTVGRDREPLVEHTLDGSEQSRVAGRFWIPLGAKELRGMAVKVARIGKPGSLEIRFGTAPGKSDLGVTRIEPSTPLPPTGRFLPLRIKAQPVEAGSLVYFDIRADGGKTRADHYVIYGPRPIGGKHWGNKFALAYHVLTDRPEDTLRASDK